ncbi:MAG TPA: penicillin acylase family protein, partial [Planctomycetota bacterium]|nr:penicillin acylase family protein [Planctomycetota bacterium]
SEFWEPPYRSRRYHQLVREKGKVAPADADKLMLDAHSLQAEELVHALIRPNADKLKQAQGDIQVAVNYLLNWDFKCTTDSIAASVFHVFYDEVLAEVFGPALGDEVYTMFLEGWNEHVDAVEAVLKNPASAWFREKPRDACVSDALARAVRRLERECGSATQAWGWGKLHTLTLRHAFHAKAPLRKLVDVGPVPTAGSGTTINNGQWIAAHPFAQLAGAGFRHVADLADLGGGSRYVVPGGVSGNPASPHRDDLFKLWLEGRTVPMPMERSAVERAAKTKTRLAPPAPVSFSPESGEERAP